MSPEIFYWLTVALKMALAASVVIAATITAERAGPLVGALVATLPVSAGPAYFFLALEQDAVFISQSALGSLIVNAATAIYATAYVLLAQRHRFLVCVPLAIAAWIASLILFSTFARDAAAAAILSIVVFAGCAFLVRRYRDARIATIKLRWYDFAFRGGLVGSLVGIILSLHTLMGPLATGALAAFPIVFTSMMLILHPRYGGIACAAVLANGVTGLIGFGIAAYVLHILATPLGVPAALLLALCITVAWNLGVFFLRRRASA